MVVVAVLTLWQILQNVFLAGGIIGTRRTGLGKDIWAVPFDQINDFLELFFVFECLYTVTLGLIKTSICFLYIRLFPNRIFRRYLWGTLVFNIVLATTFVIVDLSQCRPMSTFWLNWDDEHPGTCININAMAWSHAIINIVLDIWMIALPATQIWGLHMAWKRKIWPLIMFGFGFL